MRLCSHQMLEKRNGTNPMNQLPKEVEFFTDPELAGTPYDTIYGAYPDGRAWTLAPKATDIQLATDLLNYEEDDYYYEDY